ncbi:PhoU family transcriptional regulator [Euryarchaeota archaeon ex4484_162]|nr:MAG: PhoU family transcriptional regulator [Euryarchaeota archaeon ex4484_162]RLF30981.1 MAG: PhoU family transcriptional regulator [Thermoplasmata archaeon]
MSEEEAEKMLLELKEKAELMVDLAYSSLIYDNREIAEEVYELEDYVDKINDELQKLAIEDTRKGELDVNEVLAIIQLGISSEVIADAAREIADVQLRDVKLHPILKESLMESNEILLKVKITPKSILKDKKIGEIRLASETGMWIIAIKRGNKWIYDPTKNITLRENDILFAKGDKEGKDHFIALAEGREKKI